jgi:hypothetical protein
VPSATDNCRVRPGSFLMDYTQGATVVTLALSLWLKLDGDKYSTVLGGHVGSLIIVVSVSTLLVTAVTTVMDVREMMKEAAQAQNTGVRKPGVALKVQAVSPGVVEPKALRARDCFSFGTRLLGKRPAVVRLDHATAANPTHSSGVAAGNQLVI